MSNSIVNIPYASLSKGEVQLDDYQNEVIDIIRERISENVRVTTLGGLGGTGKSVIVAELARQYRDYAVIAPTNKAVKVLHAKGIERARTVHSLVKSPVEQLPTEEEAQEIARKLSANPPIPLTAYEKKMCVPEFGTKKDDNIKGIICDEASMIDKQMFMDLLTQEVPLIFTGDHGQLPPVSKDKDDPDFSLMKSPDLVLTKVYRNAGDIARFAAHLREGGRPAHFKTSDGSVVIGNASSLGMPSDSQVLAWMNKTVLDTNLRFRASFGMTGAICEGDRVVFDYTYRVYRTRYPKGTTATVKRVLANHDISNNPIVVLEFDDDTPDLTIPVDINFLTKAKVSPQPEYIETRKVHEDNNRVIGFDRTPNPLFGVPLRHAYAMTVHKSQGSEWPHVTVIQDMWETHEDFPKWAYTAASRAKTRLTWLFNR